MDGRDYLSQGTNQQNQRPMMMSQTTGGEPPKAWDRNMSGSARNTGTSGSGSPSTSAATSLQGPPQRLEYEQGLVACIFHDPTILDDALSAGVTPEHIVSPDLRQVYEAAARLAKSAGTFDEIDVWEDLASTDPDFTLDRINVISGAVDTTVSAARYIHGCMRQQQSRSMHTVGLRILDKVRGDVDPDEIMAFIEAEAKKLAGEQVDEELDPAVVRAVEDIRQRNKDRRGLIGLSTGLADLDTLTTGLRPGSLNVLGGRPGGGKTTLALQIAWNVAAAGSGSVRFYSLEMTRQQLAEKLLANVSGVEVHRAADGMLKPAHFDALEKGRYEISQAAINVDDRPRINPAVVRSTLRRELRREPQPALVVIDYLQLMQAADRFLPREQQISSISREFKMLALETGVPVLLLSQFNRASEQENREPRLSDLRESGAIEQDADAVLLLWPDASDPARINVKLGKNRHGPTGQATIRFDRPLHRMRC
jgi:replicative DNA helicase